MTKAINKQFEERLLNLFSKSRKTNLNHYNRFKTYTDEKWFCLYDWLIESKKFDSIIDRMQSVWNSFETALPPEIKRTHGNRYLCDLKSALNALVKFTWHIFDGNMYAAKYLDIQNINQYNSAIELVAQMIAGTAIFVDFEIIKTKHSLPNDFIIIENTIRYRKTSDKGSESQIELGGIQYNYKADDNTYANRELKKAILLQWGFPEGCFRMFMNYMACHIWDAPGDYNYYLNLKNLALVPNFLAGLTDHNPKIKNLIRKHAYDKSNLIGPNQIMPSCPKSYVNLKWRESNNPY